MSNTLDYNLLLFLYNIIFVFIKIYLFIRFNCCYREQTTAWYPFEKLASKVQSRNLNISTNEWLNKFNLPAHHRGDHKSLNPEA